MQSQVLCNCYVIISVSIKKIMLIKVASFADDVLIAVKWKFVHLTRARNFLNSIEMK